MSYTLSGGRIDASESEFAEQAGLGAVQCQLCFINLDKFTIGQREEHYENHFKEEGPSEPQQPLKNETKRDRTTSTTSWKERSKGAFDSMNWKTRDSGFWHPGLSIPPPPSFTPAVIPLLKRALQRAIQRGKTRRAVVCDHRATHVASEMFDRTWGCGYRNFLMACALLMIQEKQPAYAMLLERHIPPSVRNLQRWLEEAWAAGFDPEGAKQLKKLVGTGKWIGTADLWVALAYKGIPAELVDFNLERQPNADIVVQWIMDYFEPKRQAAPTDVNSALMSSSPITSTDKMPLILQYNGHSQAIIGFEQLKDGSVNLLTLDPGRTPNKHLRQAALAEFGVTTPNTTAEGDDKHTQPAASYSNENGKQDHHHRSHTIKNLIHGSPLRKHGKRRAVEPPLDQRGKQRHVHGPSGATNVRSTSPSPTPKRGAALAPRGGSSTTVAQHETPQLDLSQTMRFFRKDAKQLNKKDSYQILYFPLTPPLTEAQRESRRAVYSTRIC
ncbi:peptidase family C78-domain-containing protein [Schizophyllum amplum]|uniref:Peptidase family C78-domain-containing protein n=1 Tax=Schizophyllum amplum TaxID=97359 RepID=A0A550BYQ4_9AGAR|nr:peptidase family C78-domain-containing protein [Auriculariopsis ampla]